MDAADVLGLPRRRAAQRGAQAGELAQVLVVPRVTEDLSGVRGVEHVSGILRKGRCADVRERRLAKFRQNVARFRLYRLRFLQENNSKYAFCSIFQNLPDSQAEIFEI